MHGFDKTVLVQVPPLTDSGVGLIHGFCGFEVSFGSPAFQIYIKVLVLLTSARLSSLGGNLPDACETVA